jgi:fibronectin-binding autotransporter adhesin
MNPQSVPVRFHFRIPKISVSLVLGMALMLSMPAAHAQTEYVWTNLVSGDASGSWTTPANWSPNGLPGSGDTANFSTLDITVNSTVSPGGNQTNANLIFGDVTASSDWVVDASGILTLKSALGSPTITVTNRAATIQAEIDGTNGFTKLGAGALILSGQNLYSGVTTQSLGTLTIATFSAGTPDAPASGPFGASTLSLEGGTLNTATGAGVIYNSISVPAGKTVAMGTTVSGAALSLAGSISGGGTINESGNQTAGTHLSGTNSGFTGTFNSTGNGSHRMRFDNANSGSAAAIWNLNNNNTDGYGYAFGGGTIFFGALQGGGNMRSDAGGNTVTILQIGDLNLDSTWTGTINANGTQVIAINKVGSGKLVLSGNNSYNGFTTINSGVLQLGTGGGAGMFSSALVTNFSRLAFSYNRADTFAFPALLVTGTGSLSFTNIGTGIMTLTGTNNETGDTTIAAGTVRLLNPNSLPSGLGAGNLILNGTLDVNSNSVVLNGLFGSGNVDNLNTNGGIQTLTIGSNDVSSLFSGAIKNSAAPTNGSALAVNKVGAGTINLAGVNIYNGSTTISGGELDINTSKSGGGAITVNAGTTLGIAINSASSIPAASLTAGAGSVLSFSGLNSTTIAPINATNLAPSGTVTINIAGSFGAGTQYPLIRFRSYTGTGGFALGSLPVGVTANLVTNGGNTIALNVSAALPLVWKGNVSTNWDIGTTANWTLNGGASMYVNGQTVQFNDTAATGNVNISATVSPGGVVVNNNSLNYTISSDSGSGIGGSGGITKLGTGTLTLSGLTNTYSGFTAISGGTVVIDADNNLGVAGTLTLSGGALSAATSLTLAANRILALGLSAGAGAGAIDVSSGQVLTVAGVVANNLSGTGSLIKTGAGTLTLKGANTYSGSTTVTAGTLSTTAAQQSGGAVTVSDGATLAVSRTGGATLPVSALTLGTGGATTLQLGNLGSAAAVITATNLTASGAVTISIVGGVPALGEVPLIKYSGSIGGSGFSGFTLASLPPGVTAVLTNDTVNNLVGLLVSDVGALTWTGSNGITWDVGVTTNWQILGSNVTFQAGSGVVLDDTAFTNQLNLNVTASVFNMLVTNTVLSYTLNGSGALSGPMTLTKSGTNSFTLANLGDNNFTGGTVIQQGTLDVRVSNGLGTGPVTLAGGTLENNSATTVTITNTVYIQPNTTNFLQGTGGADPQLVIAGNLTGSGTVVAMLQGSSLGGMGLSGDNSGFTGTFITSNNTQLRFNFNTASAGSASANWILNSTGTDNHRISFGNGTISFGSLSGNGNCRQDVGNTLSILRIGDLNTDSSWGGTLNQGTASQRIGILKVGTGTWTITASQPYTGPTTVSNGVLALANDPVTFVDGAIPGTPTIYIAPGATLDVSGRSDQNFSLGAAQVLSGSGAVNGSLDSFGGGTIAPGDGITRNVGTLTVSNTLSLAGTTWMKLNRAGGPNSDRLAAQVALNYGGTLVITNVGPALQPGDTFTLFSGPTFNGSAFATIVLPNYQLFDTSNLGVNGTITFLGTSAPQISSIDFSTLASGSITVNATNGLPNGPLNVLTSTNAALPLNNWTPVTTNVFDGLGNYSEVITVDPAALRQFFIIRAR